MCYHDTHFFTIIRSDEFMVGRRSKPDQEPDLYYTIDPESLIVLIERQIKNVNPAMKMVVTRQENYGKQYIQIEAREVRDAN